MTRAALKLVPPAPPPVLAEPAFPLADLVREALARRERLKAETRDNDALLASLGREAADAQRIPMRLNPDQLRRSLDRGEL